MKTMAVTLIIALLNLAISVAGQSAGAVAISPKGAITREARPRLLLNLTDGSRIIGTTELATVPLHSESIGDVKVPLQKIASLKFGDDHKTATVTLSNGDKFDGTVNLSTIVVETVFGTIHVALKQLRDLQVGVDVGRYAIQTSSTIRNYVEVPASDTFDITASWTLEFWAKISGGNGELISPIMRGGDECGSAAAISIDVYNGSVQFGAIDANGQTQLARAKMNIVDGQWHHWAGVVGGGQMRLYIDGVRVAAHSFVAGATGSTCPLCFAYRATHGSCFMDGSIDEIRISSVARYSTNFSPATSYATDGDTIAYWRFNEGKGSIAHDENGKHDGVLRGPSLPLWVDGVTRVNR
jgi:hypothetical protein